MDLKKELKGIPLIVEEVKSIMCDKYCKYPEAYEGEQDELLDEVCAYCPMGYL